MEKQKKSKNIFREVVNLIIRFLRPCGISDEVLTIPKNVKVMGFKIGFMNLFMTIISLIFAFILKATNMAIERKFILLGIILFMLYRGQQVIQETFHLFESSESKKFELIFKNEITFIASQIIGKTSNKVLKYDEFNNLYKIMNNESVLNTIKNYLKILWQQKIQHTFDVFQIISVIAMLIVSILTNTSISQTIFIPLLLIFSFISFLTSVYSSFNEKEYYEKDREYNNEQSLIINDLLRVPVIVKSDLDMRIEKFQKTLMSSNNNINQFHKKLNFSRLFISILETFSQYGIIIFYLSQVEWSTINLATITQIAAILIIVETALGNIRKIANTLNAYNKRLIVLEKEEKDMLLILDVYHKESYKNYNYQVNQILINPFTIKYVEESQNDRPFTLTSKNKISINKNEVVILYGPSGSGKSTFMKMLTERIRLEKSVDIPSTSRFLFYDETLKLGSFSIFEELFCCSQNPNLLKMKDILENLFLWNEINSNCFDVWQWMKEKQFNQSLSNGQKQRLILAKILYWLDDSIDVIVLDECTSGLDDKNNSDSADAEKILAYIIQYANLDKNRIVIISTHQNIDGVKESLSHQYNFRNFQFIQTKTENIIQEI